VFLIAFLDPLIFTLFYCPISGVHHIAIARANQDRAEEALCLFEIGQVEKWHHRKFEAALPFYEQALAIYQELNDLIGVSSTLGELGGIYANLGDAAQFKQYTEQALSIRQKLGDRIGSAVYMRGLAEIALATGDLTQAEQFGRESLAIFREFGNQWGIYEGVAVLTSTFPSILRGDADLVATENLIAEAQTLAHRYNYQVGVARTLMLQGYLAARHADYGKALQLAEIGCTTAAEDPFQWTLGNALRAYAHAGLGQFVACGQWTQIALQSAWLFKVERVMQSFLPLAALYYAYGRQDVERAVELYALAFRNNDSITDALQQWTLYLDLRQMLQTTLGTAAYDIRYKRGLELEITFVVQELLAAFDDTAR
jgi:tetratricopeptide (TPR) repeat protein